MLSRYRQMYNRQVSNPPSAAYYLTLIGGILGILAGLFLLFILIGIWIIIANVLMIIFAQQLISQPTEHSKYGTYILVLSILSSLNIIALIGGILALTYQPIPIGAAQPYRPYSPYAQPPTYTTARYCQHCGNPVSADSKFCQKCGAPVYP